MVELRGVRVILRDKRLEDAEFDYIWRCDPELARLDAAFPLTMNYDRYLKIFQDQLRYPTPGSQHFAIEAPEEKFIGNCMYYDLDSISREAELGIVIGDREYWSGAYGYDAVVTLLDYMFSEKNLNRVYLHTLEWNKRAQRCFSNCGFNPIRGVRRMGQDFILMEVLRDQWLEKAEARLSTRWTYLEEKGGQCVRAEERPPAVTPNSSASSASGDN